jgi:hypothetical protein
VLGPDGGVRAVPLGVPAGEPAGVGASDFRR